LILIKKTYSAFLESYIFKIKIYCFYFTESSFKQNTPKNSEIKMIAKFSCNNVVDFLFRRESYTLTSCVN